jgi:hypothetical protein
MIERVADCYIYWTIVEGVGVVGCLKVCYFYNEVTSSFVLIMY